MTAPHGSGHGSGPSAAVPANAAPGAQGTVFDIGYQRYEGPREGRGRARIAVFKDGVRAALGMGRGGRAKILPWVFIGALVAMGLIFALVAGAMYRFGVGELAGQLPSHSDFYGIASMFFLIFAAVVAPELLCPDRRSGAINLYLVRPLSSTDYVAARWLAFFAVSLFVAWLPQYVLMLGLVMGNPEPMTYLREHWPDAPRILVSGAALAAYTTTLAMLVAAFTTRRAYAAVFLVGLFVISTPFTTALAMETEGPAGQWISMFNLSNIPVHVNDLIFGEPGWVTEPAPAGQLPDGVLFGWYLLWVVLPAAILVGRYRRLTP